MHNITISYHKFFVLCTLTKYIFHFTMKFFAALIAFATVACVVLADKTDKKDGMVASSYGGGAPSYGGGASASYSAPPCPKNYLFSCQPNLTPVPCAPGGGCWTILRTSSTISFATKRLHYNQQY